MMNPAGSGAGAGTTEIIDAADPAYDPRDYTLARLSTPASGEGAPVWWGPWITDPTPVVGVTWSPAEFRTVAWVAEYDGELGDAFRARVLERYGDVIPAADVVLDYCAEDYDRARLPILTGNSTPGCVTKDHVRALTGIADVRQALRRLYQDGVIVPLTAELLAPGLVLQAAA